MHSVTNGQTDGQTDGRRDGQTTMTPIAVHTAQQYDQ